MREIEKRIQEKRAALAAKNKLMGFTGKLGVIARNLGQPLVATVEGGEAHDIYQFPDLYNLPDERDPSELRPGYAKSIMDQIPMMDIEGNEEPDSAEWSERREDKLMLNSYTTGWFFDGLSRGIHLEIKYDDWGKTLLARYKGYEVYKEVGGELLGYAPGEWEEQVERLYKVAKALDRTRKADEKAEEVQAARKEQTGWWQQVRQKWGL